MGKNLDKSRRRWYPAGYCRCDECDQHAYGCVVSDRPTHVILCQDCWEWIYIHDKQGDRRQPRLPGL